MHRVFIGIGSNIHPAQNIRAGVQELSRIFGALRLSSVYQSRAVGFDGPDFYNLVAEVQSELPVSELYRICREIEIRFGRSGNTRKFSSRTLDLDLLLVGEHIVPEDEPNLPPLPRPEIDFNAFVLWPLAEIAPHVVHPLSKRPLASLWQDYLQQHSSQQQSGRLAQQLWPIQFDWGGENDVSAGSVNTLATACSRQD